MGRLVVKDFEILMLKYIEGWSYYEIVVYFGIGYLVVEV